MDASCNIMDATMPVAEHQKLTLIIPTYNRPVLLADLLHTLQEQGWDSLILIADSSVPAVQEVNHRLCRDLPLTIKHACYPGDMELGAKVAAACAAVTTPYLALCADDDLPMPGAMESAVAFLDAHPDHVACHGDYYDCSYAADGAKALRLSLRVTPIDASTAVERMLFLLAQYQYLFYAVCRTETYRDMIGGVRALRSHHFGELWSALHIVLTGKVGRLPTPYSVRNSSIPTIVEGRRCDPNLSFSDSGRTFFADYLAMRRKACAVLRRMSPELTPAVAGQAVDTAFALYMRRCFSSDIVLGGLQERGLIGQGERERLYRMALDRTLPEAEAGVLSDISMTLASTFARGWPHGVQG